MPFHTVPPILPQAAGGFPSPAADHTEGTLDLVRLVVRKPAATFYMRVVGASMAGAGIGDGDVVVVDRSLTPRDGDVVVAVIGDGLACKRVAKVADGWELASEGDGPTIAIDPDQGVEIWGVVTWSFREHRRL
ncbi:MAG: S24 family peptidase [Rhodospirillaceae bacterium]